MKITGTVDHSEVSFYQPFVHFYSDEDGHDYVEALVRVKPDETLESIAKMPVLDTLIVIININKELSQAPSNSTPKIVYSNPILLPEIEDPDLKVIVIVVYDDPEEGGTATVRYRDIP
jgi:hypothetical protein